MRIELTRATPEEIRDVINAIQRFTGSRDDIEFVYDSVAAAPEPELRPRPPGEDEATWAVARSPYLIGESVEFIT